MLRREVAIRRQVDGRLVRAAIGPDANPAVGLGRWPTAEFYRRRNIVERSFGRFKQWRGIATRYDNYAGTYFGGVLLAAIVIHDRLGWDTL